MLRTRLTVIMRLRIPHPVQTWFTSIGGTSKRNPLLHRSDHTTADASASAQSNPAVLEAIQDLCYEIFAIPVATTEAVHIAQFVCGHIYEFAQSSQPSLQKMAMELLPTLIHVYLVMLVDHLFRVCRLAPVLPRSSVTADEWFQKILAQMPPSEAVSCMMWEWAHWLMGRRTRLRSLQHNLAPITHTPGFTKPGDMEEPSPPDFQSTGQPLDTQHIHWADGMVRCKRQIGSLPSPGF
ncbi:unnamed protein product [Schistocephalus solidus]|uniref:Uncharacterized protein n=1 Tax=Schistocephalus solidus TaxID=70667 RepID=A0A183SLC5_SCHSO|nr:unnamed protein product [Schistocephalus solidus]